MNGRSRDTEQQNELEKLARLMGAILVFPERTPKSDLTEREQDALDCLGRRPRSTLSVAVELVIERSWAFDLLRSLEAKGYAARVGNHTHGGWIRVHESRQRAA